MLVLLPLILSHQALIQMIVQMLEQRERRLWHKISTQIDKLSEVFFYILIKIWFITIYSLIFDDLI